MFSQDVSKFPCMLFLLWLLHGSVTFGWDQYRHQAHNKYCSDYPRRFFRVSSNINRIESSVYVEGKHVYYFLYFHTIMTGSGIRQLA